MPTRVVQLTSQIHDDSAPSVEKRGWSTHTGSARRRAFQRKYIYIRSPIKSHPNSSKAVRNLANIAHVQIWIEYPRLFPESKSHSTVTVEHFGATLLHPTKIRPVVCGGLGTHQVGECFSESGTESRGPGRGSAREGAHC